MKPVRIVLADDHALVRAGIRALLERVEGVDVVGEADSGPAVLGLIEAERPDCAFLDIGMRGMSGLEVAARVARDYPEVRVVILSMHANEGYVEEALRAGVVGYLLKDEAAAELDQLLATVRGGERYLSPAISRTVITAFVGRGESLRLTPRQREVLTLIAEGKSTREISGVLHISVKTVETHRAQLMKRLDIHDVAGLVKYALHSGLIPPVA